MQGGRLKPDEKQSPKPRGGQARWRVRRRPGAAAHRGRHRAQGRRVVRAAGDRADAGRRSSASAPRPIERRRRPTLAARFAEHPMRLHGFLRDQHCIAGHRAPAGQRGLPPGQALAVRQRRRSSGSTSAERLVDGHPRRASTRALAFERSRDDMSSSADRPGRRPPPRRRALPGLRRHDPRGRVPQLHGRLLPHLPDRRQGPGRQHHQQVPQVARPSRATGRTYAPAHADPPASPSRATTPPPSSAPAIRGARRTSPRRSSTPARAASTRSAACSASPAPSKGGRCPSRRRAWAARVRRSSSRS